MRRSTLSACRLAGVLVLLCVSTGGRAQTPAPSPASGPPPLPAMVRWHNEAGGLQWVEIAVGQGATPHDGQTVVVHFTGWLDDGMQFDSTRDRKKAFGFVLGSGQVIKGWDEGVRSMRVGGKRRLVVPPALGYGATGVPGLVPPNATLTFDVELLRIIDK